MKKIKGYFWYPVRTRPHQTRRKSWAGPQRDIVGVGKKSIEAVTSSLFALVRAKKRMNSIKNKKKRWQTWNQKFFQFWMVKKVFGFFVKTEECKEKQKEKWQVWTQIFEKSREYCNFKNSVPHPQLDTKIWNP